MKVEVDGLSGKLRHLVVFLHFLSLGMVKNILTGTRECLCIGFCPLFANPMVQGHLLIVFPVALLYQAWRP